MPRLSYDDVLNAVDLDNHSMSITVTADLQPAAGRGAPIAGSTTPGSQSDDSKKSVPTYQWSTVGDEETGEELKTIILDSHASMINRIEEILATAIEDEHPLLSALPRIRLTDSAGNEFFDYTLPHRFVDAHVRSSDLNAKALTADPDYVALRRHTPKKSLPLMMTSPISLLFGFWDSQNPELGTRETSKLEGTFYGVLSRQDGELKTGRRRGVKSDPVSPNMKLTKAELEEACKRDPELAHRYSSEKIKDLFKNKKPDHKINLSASGFGSVPTDSSLSLVPCRSIRRTYTMSLERFRQLRFGLGREEDKAARALLVALCYNLVVRASYVGALRRDCVLVMERNPQLQLIGSTKEEATILDWPSVAEADALLKEALEAARAHGIDWSGQTMDVTMNTKLEEILNRGRAEAVVSNSDDDSE